MDRGIAVIGATSSLGMCPYEDGEPRDVSRAPAVLRQRGLISRIGAEDLGDVTPPAYTDYLPPPRRARNEQQVVIYSRALARRVEEATSSGRFALVLGGDCSIVLGCLLGLRPAAAEPIGLAYVDAHADFATADESRSRSASGMSLALASGRGASPLARLVGRTPLVDGRHVVLAGRRDTAEGPGGRAALTATAILDVPDHQLQAHGFGELGARAARRLAAPDVRGFWIHLDADVLNPAIMFAVDSPRPGGPMPQELVEFLSPLVHHPRARGLSISTYDPAFDPDRSCARQLVGLFEMLFTRGANG